MNKNDLIVVVVEKIGFMKVQVGEVVDVIFDVVIEMLKSGDEVCIIGFGNFLVFECVVIEGCNLCIGEMIQILVFKMLKFKVGKGLKDVVNF